MASNASRIPEDLVLRLVRFFVRVIVEGVAGESRNRLSCEDAMNRLVRMSNVFQEHPSVGDCLVDAWPGIKRRNFLHSEHECDTARLSYGNLLRVVMEFGHGSLAKTFFEKEAALEVARLWKEEMATMTFSPVASFTLPRCLLVAEHADVFMENFLRSAEVDGKTFLKVLLGRGLRTLRECKVDPDLFQLHVGMILSPFSVFLTRSLNVIPHPIPMATLLRTGGQLVERVMTYISKRKSGREGNLNPELTMALECCVTFVLCVSRDIPGHSAFAAFLKGSFLPSFAKCSPSFHKLSGTGKDNIAISLIRQLTVCLVFRDVISNLSNALCSVDAELKRYLRARSCAREYWSRLETRLLECRVWTWAAKVEQVNLGLKLGYSCSFVSTMFGCGPCGGGQANDHV